MEVARKTGAKEQCFNVKTDITVDENLSIGNNSKDAALLKPGKDSKLIKKCCTASVIHKDVFVVENFSLSSDGVSSLDITEAEK